MSFDIGANTGSNFDITISAPAVNPIQIKVAGTFVVATATKIKVGGTFQDFTLQIKVGGTFV